MKYSIFLLVTIAMLLVGGPLKAEAISDTLNKRLSIAVEKNIQADQQLSSLDAYGTPLVIKLARQGNTKLLAQLAQNEVNGDFLNAKDKYGNNLFHVAKNADTVQVAASLVRKFYGAKTTQQITLMVDQRNLLGETPLLAQVNAGHVDTFRSLYSLSTLKATNDMFKNQLSRLKGSDPSFIAEQKAIYCHKIQQLASANGRTLLQAAQDQVPYHPEMAPLAQRLESVIPCLAEN